MPLDADYPHQIKVSVSYVDNEGICGLLTFRSGWEQEAMPLLEKIREAIAEVTKGRPHK